MAETLKEFQQKVKNRKFAIDNSWRGSPEDEKIEGGLDMELAEGNSQQELPWGLLEENLSAANECKFFDGYLPLESNRRILGKWIVLMKRIIRRLLKIFMGWYIFPQYQRMSHFNGKVINVLSLERDILANTVQQNQQMAQRLNEQERQFREICQRYETLIQELQGKLELSINENINLRQIERDMLENIKALQEKWDELVPENEKMRCLESKMREDIQKLWNIQSVLTEENERLRQQGENVLTSTQELQDKQKELFSENDKLNVRMRKLENLPTDDDEFYHHFEERFRGSQEIIRDRLQVYVPVVMEYIKDWSKARFIDMGSGRGEWLDILRENGAKDYVGVDLNARQNALCEEKGHRIVQADCIQYLKELPENSIDLITGFQIIEHLCLPDLMELFQQSYRVLRQGGMILFETQNPRNLIVGADTFYIDPSHKRPLEPRMVSFMAEWCGYTEVRCMDANAYPNWAGITAEPENEEIGKIVETVNEINYQLYGPQDYAVIGVKE